MLARLHEHIARDPGRLAIATSAGTWTYGEVGESVARWLSVLESSAVPSGSVTSIEGDYDLGTVSAFIAAIEHRLVAVPLSADSAPHATDFLEVGEVEWRVRPNAAEPVSATGRSASHQFYLRLRQDGVPGLVLFSSGSTGKNKAAVHDLSKLLAKFEVPRHCYRTLVFLQLDHIGGVNTLLYTLANGGAVVVPAERSPASVAACIERHRVELLPTSPTFLNLLLLSGEHEQHDLSSLALITYGTEPMPEATLEKVGRAFPNVRLLQTYGLTEVGILRSQSRDNQSLWVRVGGEGYVTKVVEGRLWVKAESAMLGYLNAPSPFDAEGYFDTGDRVEVSGDWLRILGRESEIINVGGSKVYPAEVEGVLLQMDGVEDVVVYGEPNAITGEVVAAAVRLATGEPVAAFRGRMRQFCLDRLPTYKVPARVRLVDGPLHTERFKRRRHDLSGRPADTDASTGQA